MEFQSAINEFAHFLASASDALQMLIARERERPLPQARHAALDEMQMLAERLGEVGGDLERKGRS